jgi:hypothetical protein
VICTHAPTITASWELYTYTLTGAEADAITDYTDLYGEITST